MLLKKISLENFRNHSYTTLDCSRGVNLILGCNGEGKTNILEGISVLFISKSFFKASDQVILKNGEKKYRVSGKIFSDRGIEHENVVEFELEKNAKRMFVNKVKIEKQANLIGKFPIVILHPEQYNITSNLPQYRREFVDFIISQSDRLYLNNLIEYRRILKQRNRILSTNFEEKSTIESWNEGLISAGSVIIKKRIEFVKDFRDIISTLYTKISGSNEFSEFGYLPSFKIDDESIEAVRKRFDEELARQKKTELKVGCTIVGPHRDDFILKINGLEVRNYASQGQHKSLLIALKLAEFFYVKERCGETPILLLDDVFSELDIKRAQRILSIMEKIGQIFLTSTENRVADWIGTENIELSKFYVENGKVKTI